MKWSQPSSTLAWTIYFAITWAEQGAIPTGKSPAGLTCLQQGRGSKLALVPRKAVTERPPSC